MARVLIALTAGVVLLGLSVTAQAQDKPRYGGVLTWFVYADPGRLDTHTESGLSVQQVTAGVFSSLIQHDPEDPTKVIADLAERWTLAPDGKTYTFALRSGVKWHDGQPFSAADVKATFDRILNPEFRSPKCGAMLKPMVAGVDAVDGQTVRFRLKFPAAPFVAYLASGWCPIAAKHVLDKYGDLMKPEAQIGTGPFKFKRYERGNLVEWVKNPDYFIPGLPYLDGVKQFILPSSVTQLAAAKAGQVMLWDTWPPMERSQADELRNQRKDTVDIYRGPVNNLFIVIMNTQRPPFNNPDLRRALHLAIDRQELVAKGLEGAGTPCAVLDPRLVGDFALPLDEVNALPGCRQPKAQDLAEARRLVEKHFPNGVDIEAEVRPNSNYVDRAQLLLSQLRKIGIRGTLKVYESAAGLALYGKGAFTLIPVLDTGMNTSDPADVFSLLYVSDAGRNYGRWTDPRVDELAERGLREANRAKRRQIYAELQRYLLTKDSPAVPVAWIEGWFFLDKRVRGYKQAATMYENNTFMKVWLAP